MIMLVLLAADVVLDQAITGREVLIALMVLVAVVVFISVVVYVLTMVARGWRN